MTPSQCIVSQPDRRGESLGPGLSPLPHPTFIAVSLHRSLTHVRARRTEIEEGKSYRAVDVDCSNHCFLLALPAPRGLGGFYSGAPGGNGLLPTRPEVGLNARAGGDCHGANRGLGEQTSEIGDFAERGRRILLGWDGGRYSQRGRSRLEQAGHPLSAHTAAFTGRCAPGVTPESH